jgi:3-hydroxyisobutyrate dehydrogenase
MPEAVGFVGLGTIGRPLVDNLVRAGVPTTVFDLDRAAVDDMVSRGARPAASLAELAGTARIVGVCVPADNHVRAVLAGDDGLLAHLPAGAVVAIHSTVLPETVRWAAGAAAEWGIGVVEAPVTGGAAAAEQGRSTFLLAGAPEHVEAIEPILAACGDVRVHLDELGDASRLKLCINLQTCVTFMGIYEAATLAKQLGLPVDGLKSAMRANGQLGEMSANYFMMQEFSPATLADPALRATLARNAAIVDKDLTLIAALADEIGARVPAARLAGAEVPHFFFLDDPETSP